MKKKITDILTKEDIDLYNKLDNMESCELSEEICYECRSRLDEIENVIWDLMNNDKKFSNPDYYNGLYEPTDTERELNGDRWVKSAEFYNCDYIYMVAIAQVLGLRKPKSSGDIKMFW